MPITWDELDDPDLRPDRWTIDTIADRLATAGDPLAPLIGLQQRLPRSTSESQPGSAPRPTVLRHAAAGTRLP